MVARDLQGAIDLAARVLEDLGIKEPPVPSSFIHFIDTTRPVHVAVEPLHPRTRGATMLAPDGSEWRVVLNANDRIEVRRFTLAHEAFHIACGTGLAFRRDGRGEFYECSLADHFASHLLIPEAWRGSLADPSPQAVARRCAVTLGAGRLAVGRGKAKVPTQISGRHPRASRLWTEVADADHAAAGAAGTL